MAYSARSLPLGVAVLSVLIGLVGAFLLVVGLLALLAISVGYVGSGTVFVGGALGTLLLFVFAGILLAVAFGLWHQELWALVLSIIVVAILLLSLGVNGGFAAHPLETVILLVMLIYLVAVNRQFR